MRRLLLTLATVAAGVLIARALLRPRPEDDRPSAMPRVLTVGPPLRVETLEGGVLELPGPPRRVLPAFASAVDFLLDLLPPERVSALPPTARNWSALADATRDTAGWSEVALMPEFTAEVVLGLRPDLVLVQPWSSAATVATLRERGLAVLNLPVPTSWEDVLATVRLLATLLDVEPRGAHLLGQLQARAARLLERAEGPPGSRPLRVLSYSSFGSGATTAGARSTGDQVIRLAGMVNAAREAGLVGNPPIDHERVLVLAPDVLLVPAPNEETPGSSRAILLAEPLLAGLDAIRERRVVEIPMHLFTAASHRLLDAAELLADGVEPWRPGGSR